MHLSLTKASKKEIYEVRKRIGYVFQNYNLFANKTAFENVTEGLIIAHKYLYTPQRPEDTAVP